MQEVVSSDQRMSNPGMSKWACVCVNLARDQDMIVNLQMLCKVYVTNREVA